MCTGLAAVRKYVTLWPTANPSEHLQTPTSNIPTPRMNRETSASPSSSFCCGHPSSFMIASSATHARASFVCAALLLACASCRGALGFRADYGLVVRATIHQQVPGRSPSISSSSTRHSPSPTSGVTTSHRFLAKVQEGPESLLSTTPAPPSSGHERAAEGQLGAVGTSSTEARLDEARRFLEQASELRKQADEASSRLSQQQSEKWQRASREVGATGLSNAREDGGAPGAATRAGTTATAAITSPFALPPPTINSTEEPSAYYEYRLHVDIGREPGSWMEPRWGASGRRIEFTLDVRFTGDAAEDGEDGDGTPRQLHASSSLVRDGKSLGWLGAKRGSESSCFGLETAPYARMRSGFDRMACLGGLYRIERGSKQKSDATVRFCIRVDGTTDYGDVTIPPGYLYFSIPAFSSKLSLISRKPGPVTVRQPGWNTGWRREESRIVGVFVATPLADKRP
jgi:hypothetical protein